MEELEIKNLAELDDSYTEQAVKLFVESFYEPLSNLSEDKTRLFAAFQHSFVKEQVHVGLLNNKVVGMVGHATQKSPGKIVDRKALQREFGSLRGWMAYSALGQQPIPIAANQAYIEDVATDSEARGKGVATKLIHHLLDTLPYDEFTLEVVDTNTSALRLYEKLGFVVFDRKPQRFFKKQAGFNEKLYMIKKR